MYTENNHHLWFRRKDMLSFSLTTRLRNHEASQIILPVDVHNELHANITDGMAIPSARIARLALGHLNSLHRRYKALDATRSLIDHFDTPFADHLSRQLPFLIMGTEALKKRHL